MFKMKFYYNINLIYTYSINLISIDVSKEFTLYTNIT